MMIVPACGMVMYDGPTNYLIVLLLNELQLNPNEIQSRQVRRGIPITSGSRNSTILKIVFTINVVCALSC
jgi:hypothetical protein